jgi:hypothetical protein
VSEEPNSSKDESDLLIKIEIDDKHHKLASAANIKEMG